MRVKKNSSVIINGREYDALTGLPVTRMPAAHTPANTGASQHAVKTHVTAVQKPRPIQSAVRTMSDIRPVNTGPKPSRPEASHAPAGIVQETAPVPKAKNHHVAQQIHRTPERSQTLNRHAIKKPVPQQTVTQRSTMITRFAPHPKPLQRPVVSEEKATVAARHDVQTTGNRQLDAVAAPAPVTKHQEVHPPAQLSSRELKEQLIKERLAEVRAPEEQRDSEPRVNKFFQLFKKPQLKHIAVSTLAVLILGGYFAYVNMPNLSVRVAAARAGVSASYPEYKPTGYKFNGPVAYAPGEVSLEFASNTNDQSYTVTQRSSNWDSQAVLDNFVTQKSDSYLTYSEQGLTIYTFENKAAWVNRGVFYTIDGNAPLSSDQVLRIAASL
jgi:hypothetical protein